MSKHTIMVLAVLLAGSGAALAQKADGPGAAGGGGGGSPPAAQQNAPGQAKESGSSAREMAPGQTKPEGSSAKQEAPGQTGRQAAEPDGKGSPEGKGSKAGKRAESDRSKDSATGKGGDGKKSARDDDNGKASDGKARAAGGKSDNDKAARVGTDKSEKGAESKSADVRGGSTTNATEMKDGRGEVGATRHGDASAGSKSSVSIQSLPAEKQTRVRTVFREHRVPEQTINVAINVGTVVPRTVKLYSVPEDIVVIVPSYRSYRYFLVGDRIVIVDPDDYEIVDVILLA